MNELEIRVLIWDEHTGVPEGVYPGGIRGAVALALEKHGSDRFAIRCAHIDLPDQGLSQAELDRADVLVWWGHERHAEVDDAAVGRIVARVREHGMGFVALHSGHYSKPFQRVLGCGGDLLGGWDEDGGPERIRVCAPDHPVARGVVDFTLPREEMYGAPFAVPPPECVVLQSYFPKSGKHFPCCLAWAADSGRAGRAVYLRPGHETLPSLFDPGVQQVIANAVRWAGAED